MAIASKPALVAGVGADLALTLAVAGAAGAHFGALPSMLGFSLYLLAHLPALAAGAAGVLVLRSTGGVLTRWDRPLAGAGIGVALLFLALALLPNLRAGLPPTINDIATDLDDPPQFVAAAALPENRGRDLAHPGADFARAQRAAYPDLAPIDFDGPPERAFAAARDTAQRLDWQIHSEAPEAGRIEATQTSRLFRFVDDIVIRIRAAGAGSRIDLRSKSRHGKGDVGVNAARLRAFRDAL